MSEKRRILICRFREHVHTQKRREGEERQEVRDRGCDGGGKMASAYVRARRWVCPGAVCRAHSCDLQLMKLRVQSRRMSNKYVSRRPRRGPHARRRAPSPPRPFPRPSVPPPPLPSPAALLTLFTLFLLNPCRRFPACRLPPRRPSSRGSSSCPDAVNRLLPFSPLALTLWHARPASCPPLSSYPSVRPFGFRAV